LVSWRQGKELKDYVEVDGREIAIIPDAFFTIEDQRDLLHFFLEADQSTMTRGRFLRKMQAYWQWWKGKGHIEKFGINSFRVLTICKSDLRKENLRAVTKQADDRKTGALMFWFAAEKDIKPFLSESILKPIWQTPKDYELHELLED